MLSDVLKRWTCKLKSCTGGDGYCYVDERNDHYALTIEQATEWEMAVQEGTATLDRPPLSVFRKMVRNNNTAAAMNAIKRKQGLLPSTPGPIFNSHNHSHIHFPSFSELRDMISGQPAPSNSAPHADDELATSTPRSVHAIPARSSPVHPDSDVETEVNEYIDYMIGKYPNDERKWRDAREKLIDESLDLAQIRKMNNAAFKEISIPVGIGMKLRDCVKDFKAERTSN